MVPSLSSHLKDLYNPKAFIDHAAWLDQGFPHCLRFPTAASRRSLGRVSVPVWLIILSNQLWIVGLVDRKSTRLNSSHSQISYAVFCLQKKYKGLSIHVSAVSASSFCVSQQELYAESGGPPS